VIFWGRWRVEGVLAVSRAIGDISLKPYVTCDPEIQSKFIAEEDMYMVLASDGLWDVMSNEEVASFVVKYVCCASLIVYVILLRRDCQHQDFKYIARDLCYEATLLGSSDNITVQVVDLRLVALFIVRRICSDE
jgi:serine/threonine protein phosphatase PrpC